MKLKNWSIFLIVFSMALSCFNVQFTAVADFTVETADECMVRYTEVVGRYSIENSNDAQMILIEDREPYTRLPDEYQDWSDYIKAVYSCTAEPLATGILNNGRLINYNGDIYMDGYSSYGYGNDDIHGNPMDGYKICKYSENIYVMFVEHPTYDWMNSIYLPAFYKYDNSDNTYKIMYETVFSHLYPCAMNDEYKIIERYEEISTLVQCSLWYYDFFGNPAEYVKGITGETEMDGVKYITGTFLNEEGAYIFDPSTWDHYPEIEKALYALYSDEIAEKYLSKGVIKRAAEKGLAFLDINTGAQKYDFADDNVSFKILSDDGTTVKVRLSLPEYAEDGSLVKINDSVMVIKDGKIVYEEYGGLCDGVENPCTADVETLMWIFIAGSAAAIIFCLKKKGNLKNESIYEGKN